MTPDEYLQAILAREALTPPSEHSLMGEIGGR